MSGEQAHPLQAAAAKPERRQLFISYNHRDGDYVERLLTMLRPLDQHHGLERWDDSRIQPGMLWREEIEKALASAQVALLMVSVDFLASEFVTRSELPPLFTAAKQEGLRILWVPLRPCLWKLIPEIEQYQAVIPAGRTVAEMAEVERERAFVEIAERILSTFQEEAARQARERTEEQQRLAREQEALQRKAEQERLEREREESRSQEAERERLARERKEEEQRQAREKEERRALAEAQRWKAEAERLAREKEALEGKAEEEWQALDQPERSKADGSPAPSPLRLQVLAGSLVSDGTGFFGRRKWRVETRPVEVEGYREELGHGVALTMVRIPAGGFAMGSPSGETDRTSAEGPQHSVRLEEFFLGQTPITQAQWKVVAAWEKVELDLNSDPASFKGPNRSVEQVNWHEAVEFCRRLSARTGRTYTLPSEAQWEYACRAGTTTPFAFGETITTGLANYDGKYTYGDGPKGEDRGQTTPVGSFPANAWGLQDMHGNVWEWCLDHWHDSHADAPTDGTPWLDPQATEDVARLLRGGSWNSFPRICRSAFRNCGHPDDRNTSIGFRVCCLPPGHS